MRVVLSHVNTPQGTTNMEGALMVCAFDLDQPQCCLDMNRVATAGEMKAVCGPLITDSLLPR